ncbi:fimbrial protein [Klebsiella oxytoca]|uniref:fimbrial protein n=1 Tax=Klebsiella oxytoca TaxID=571 RepID=UPI00157A3AD0|nr:fimbrial protein [Klebsiella oxytoca]
MNRWQGVLCLGWALLMSTPTLAVENLAFRGTLVNAPCTLRPGSENLELVLGTVVDKYLYREMRTLGKPFHLYLDDCDTAVLTGVKLTFSGTESPALPGLLALDASSLAHGVAVGIETSGGQLLPLNVQGPLTVLIPGNMDILLQAFVQGEPTALANRTLFQGPFTATATFSLEYQ